MCFDSVSNLKNSRTDSILSGQCGALPFKKTEPYAQSVHIVKRPSEMDRGQQNDFRHFFTIQYTIIFLPFTMQFQKKMDTMSHIDHFLSPLHTS